jgi:hypothetical protein
MSQQLVGTCVLTSGKFYTLQIGTTNYNLKGFGCVIEEIVEFNQNTFTFSGSDTQTVTCRNTGTGNAAIGVRSVAHSWRTRTDASGNLIFEKETSPGSGSWVTKGTIAA